MHALALKYLTIFIEILMVTSQNDTTLTIAINFTFSENSMRCLIEVNI